MSFLSGMFVIVLAGIAADVVVKLARARAAVRGSPALKAELSELQRQLEEQAQTLANQGQRLQELEERCDFTERLLAQTRERTALGPDRSSPPPGPST